METSMVSVLTYLCMITATLAEYEFVPSCVKACNSSEDAFLCPFSNCSEIPVSHINPNVKNIYMPGNHIKVIPLNFTFHRLETLDLSVNDIQQIPEKAFVNISGLQILNISHNNIKTITSWIFLKDHYMVNLTEVYFQHNEIQSLEDSVFLYAPNIKILNLGHNQLGVGKVDHSSLDNLVHIEELYLPGNNLTELNTMWLSHMKQLTRLDLSKNQLTQILDQTFSDMHSLEELDLRANHLTTLKKRAFDGLDSLRVLHLSHNQLGEISPGVLSFKSLRELYLNYNPLKSVDSDVYPSSLVELFMEYMPELTDVKDGSLASLINLRRIYIQHCPELVRFSATALSAAEINLHTLVLHDNALTTLHPDTANWTNLEVLDLTSNPWYCDCEMAWITTTSLPVDTMKNTRCGNPWSVRNKLWVELTQKDMKCEKFNKFGILLVLVVTSLFLVLCAILCYRYRHRTCPCYYKAPGKYHPMRYTTNMDTEDDDMTFKDEPTFTDKTVLREPAHI